MIIHIDEIQAMKISIYCSLPLFALHYLGISGDLTESSWPLNLQHAKTLQDTPQWYQRKDWPPLEEPAFPLISRLIERPVFKGLFVSVGTPQDIFGFNLYWFQVRAGSKWMGVGERSQTESTLKRRNAISIFYFFEQLNCGTSPATT